MLDMVRAKNLCVLAHGSIPCICIPHIALFSRIFSYQPVILIGLRFCFISRPLQFLNVGPQSMTIEIVGI